jgi:hypothetical protein
MQDDRIFSPGDFYPILEKAQVMRDHIWAIVLVKYESLAEMTWAIVLVKYESLAEMTM